MKIAVVTDSTAYLTAETRQQHHIHMLPLVVNIGAKSYQEEIDLAAEDFYSLMKSAEDFPKSSQPAVGAMHQLYEELAKEHDAIISCMKNWQRNMMQSSAYIFQAASVAHTRMLLL